MVSYRPQYYYWMFLSHVNIPVLLVVAFCRVGSVINNYTVIFKTNPPL